MPRPGRPTTERAKDFKGTLRQLIRTMSHYKLPLAAAMLFAVLSTIFNIAGPKVLAKATTALATGWIARLRGTGSIDFVYIGRILLFLLGMYLLSSAFPSPAPLRKSRRSICSTTASRPSTSRPTWPCAAP